MADLSIQKDFVDGIQDIFTTLFNDGINDGLNLYLLSDNTKSNVYGENKYKIYQQPKRLVTQARLKPTQGEQDVEGIRDKPTFIVPLKSLQDNALSVTSEGLDKLRRSIVEFHGVYYTVDNVLPKTFTFANSPFSSIGIHPWNNKLELKHLYIDAFEYKNAICLFKVSLFLNDS